MTLELRTVVGAGDGIEPFCRELCKYKVNKLYESEFDLTGLSFLHVGVICALAMFMRWSRLQASRPCHVIFDPHAALTKYLQRIDFFKILGVSLKEAFSRHVSEGLMELSEIRDDKTFSANEIPTKLRDILTNATRIDASLASALDLAFGEVIDNVLNHSESSIPGLAIAQYYPSKGYVEFCVADAGIGIPDSLRKNAAYADKSDFELISSAFDYGVGENVMGAQGNDEGFGAGYGLAFTAKLVEKSRGKLWAVSHASALLIDSDGALKPLDNCWFPGTVICARINDDVALTEADLDFSGKASQNRPFYWDSQGNELEDLYEDDILW